MSQTIPFAGVGNAELIDGLVDLFTAYRLDPALSAKTVEAACEVCGCTIQRGRGQRRRCQPCGRAALAAYMREYKRQRRLRRAS